MASEPRYLEFDPAHPDEVVAVMDAMVEAGKGWINFQPAVDIDDVPPDGGFFGIFSGRGPDVPLSTWTAPTLAKGRGRGEPVMLGLQHGAGRRLKGQLEEMGHPLPDGWVILQDYAKKGLVVAVPDGVAHTEALAWLLAVARAASAVPILGMWRASIYEG